MRRRRRFYAVSKVNERTRIERTPISADLARGSRDRRCGALARTFGRDTAIAWAGRRSEVNPEFSILAAARLMGVSCVARLVWRVHELADGSERLDGIVVKHKVRARRNLLNADGTRPKPG